MDIVITYVRNGIPGYEWFEDNREGAKEWIEENADECSILGAYEVDVRDTLYEK